jgi:hypothetical protein
MSSTVNPTLERVVSFAPLRRIVQRVRKRTTTLDPALQDIAIIKASGLFDAQQYLQRNPDVARSGMDPVEHYVRHGAAEGRDPIEGFSTTYYLRNNPDVATSGINPFRHYVEYGRDEGRPPRQQPVHRNHAGAKDDARIIARSNLFDAGYYLKHNRDVAASGMNPLAHFCQYGFRELRNPSQGFDIGWYWLTYLSSDVDTNPLAHYLRKGVQDNLEIRPVGGLSEEDGQSLCDAAVRLLAPGHQALPTARTCAQVSCWRGSGDGPMRRLRSQGCWRLTGTMPAYTHAWPPCWQNKASGGRRSNPGAPQPVSIPAGQAGSFTSAKRRKK